MPTTTTRPRLAISDNNGVWIAFNLVLSAEITNHRSTSRWNRTVSRCSCANALTRRAPCRFCSNADVITPSCCWSRVASGRCCRPKMNACTARKGTGISDAAPSTGFIASMNASVPANSRAASMTRRSALLTTNRRRSTSWIARCRICPVSIRSMKEISTTPSRRKISLRRS